MGINSTNIDKSPSFNGIRYTDTFSTVSERLAINTLVGKYAHYCFADENEDGVLEFIPPSLSEAQINNAEHSLDVYSLDDLQTYKSVYKIYLQMSTTDDGEDIITDISFTKN